MKLLNDKYSGFVYRTKQNLRVFQFAPFLINSIANAYFVLVINVSWLLVVISAFYKFYFIKSARLLYFDLKLLIDV